jgi:hypothetical protein
MKSVLQHGWRATRWVGAGVWSFAVWSSWLALVGLLALQLWWFRSSELAVPAFVLRALETRLAASNLHATFGRTVFDPTGRVLLEDLKLSTPAFREPLATARLIYVHLDPWALATGDFEPEEIQLSGVSLFEPAMLSASGRPEPVVRNLEATLVLRPRELELRQLHTQIGPVGVTASGVVPIPAWQERRNAPLPVADYLAHDYPRLSHEVSTWLRQLEGVEDAEVRLALTPSDAHGVIVEASLLAGKVQLTKPYALTARAVDVATRFPVGGASVAKVELDARAAELLLADGTAIAGPRGRIRGSANLTPGLWNYTPDEIEASARSVATPLLSQPLGSTYALSRSLGPVLGGVVSTELAGTDLFADATVDLAQKSATAGLTARVGPGLLKPVSDAVGRDLTRWVTLTRPIAIAASVRLDPGWKLGNATARIDGEDVTAYGVPLDEARGRVTLDGTSLAATEVVLRTGPSRAGGSYTMDTTTRDFRFLLGGRLVPAAINPWFRSGWWERLFSHFDFSAAVPAANVDVAGRWGLPERTTVYVSVQADQPAIEGVPLDQVRTVLFVRSQFYEARELSVRHRGGSGTGTFARWADPVTKQPARLDFQGATTGLDPRELLAMLGDTGRRIAAPFRFGTAPDLQVEGRLDNDPATNEVRPTVHVQGSSPGVVEVYDFPVSNIRFTAEVKDNDITVVPEVDFGGGKGSGRVWLTGRGAQQNLRFEYTLKGAKLGPTAEALESYAARSNPTPRSEKSTYLTKASDVNVNISLNAEGPPGNLYGLNGRGRAELDGARLSEVPLFGLLSDVLPVLTLRFTKMQTDLELAGAALRLPNVKLTGANSGADAVGTYNLQNRALDFNVKAYPFSETSNPLLLPLNLITRPLSELFEMHLGGTLDKPAWSVGASNSAREPARTEAPTAAAEAANPGPTPATSPGSAP